MAITKQIVICIGTDEAKHVRARVSLLLMEGAEVINRQYHSISIGPGDDLAAIRAGNEAHIAKPGGGVPGAPWPAIPDDEWIKVEKCCAVVHTPDVLIKASAEQESMIADVRELRATVASEFAALKEEQAVVAALKARVQEEKAKAA